MPVACELWLNSSVMFADFVTDNKGLPVILWWTDFTKDPGSVYRCGDMSCYVTNNRQYKGHKDTKVSITHWEKALDFIS